MKYLKMIIECYFTCLLQIALFIYSVIKFHNKQFPQL